MLKKKNFKLIMTEKDYFKIKNFKLKKLNYLKSFIKNKK